MKKKAAYIDHSFKKKTRSNEFLKEILSKEYNLTELWDDSWKGGNRVSLEYLNREKFSTIFFFQILPPPRYLKKINCKNIVWFPMYDGEEGRHYSYYIPYLDHNMKIFSFSKKLYGELKKAGLNCYYYKYHQKSVAPLSLSGEAKRVFFWVRTPAITWSIVKELLGKNKIDKIIMKMTPDPNYKLHSLSKEDIKRYNIQIVNHWFDKEEYYKLLSSCNIFIAPRRAEGIGMSFIEALSRGMCVIAPDNSTMNEYIIHGKNGLLYDLKKPEELDLSNLCEMCENAIKIAKTDNEFWEKTKQKILVDLTKPNKKPRLIKLLYLKSAYVYYLCYPKLRSLLLLPLAKIKSFLNKFKKVRS
jgi:glycosyltransferase involved in cell wall biosynthesis